ncbi:MAG: glycosyltransferase [Gammaproteobacteria bacterium]
MFGINRLKLFPQRSILQKMARFFLLCCIAPTLKVIGFGNRRRKCVLFVGQCYYSSWYLSRELRKIGWKADLYNWDTNTANEIYYHGHDFAIPKEEQSNWLPYFKFYIQSLRLYDVFHFANFGGITYGGPLQAKSYEIFGDLNFEILFLKALGKKIVYSNNGCLDGVSQSAFSKWGPESVCSICSWQHEPLVCSDEKNLAWGKFRNEVADYQCTLGGNRVDYNDDPSVHEVPEYYCLDKEFWRPNLNIPIKYQLPVLPKGYLRVYHSVGNKKERTTDDGVNIKSSHIYIPLIEKLRSEGIGIELLEPTDIPNKEVRYIQAQSDIVVDMLTYGWFGANAREAMMLGKPVICFIRAKWLDSVREEIPGYAEELPIVNATPNTVESVLRDLIANPAKRNEIGKRSRAFAVKWHSSIAASKRFNRIYSDILNRPINKP